MAVLSRTRAFALMLCLSSWFAPACGEDGASSAGSDRSDARTPDATVEGDSSSGGGGSSAGGSSGVGGVDGGGGAAGGSRDPDAGDLDGAAPPPDAEPDTSTDAGDGGSSPGVRHCTRHDVAVPERGVCERVRTGGSGLVLRGTVLGPEEVLRNGEVFVDGDGFIACADCDCTTAPGYGDATVVDCGHGVISPGLINAHEHLGNANNSPQPHGTVRYDHRHEWRLGMNGHAVLPYAGSAPVEVQRGAELTHLLSGTTSIAGVSGATGLLRNLESAADNEDLLAPPVRTDTFPLADNGGTLLTSGCAYDASRTQAADLRRNQPYVPHIAEGVDLAAHNELACVHSGDGDLIRRESAFVHAIALTPLDAQRLRAEGAKFVWSPRSNLDLYGNTAPVTLLDRMGVPIALGMDWVVSGSMNLSRELRCADTFNASYLGGYFDDRALWRMVTTNAALAVGAEKAIGRLVAGLAGDIAVFDGSAREDHRAVIDAGPPDVVLVIRGGTVLYGDAALVDALRPDTCEELDVCTRPKRACVEADLGDGTTAASLASAIEAYHPLFACPVPDNEPSCVPFRTGEYEGVIAPGDSDGDGVANELDLCPSIFDPPRPMDGGRQPDADGDTLGDACDPCPMVAGSSCVSLRADDLDDDGIANGVDGCPYAADADRADHDGDGHGDACDPCPDPNPGPRSCVPSLRDPASASLPPLGTRVRVDSVFVTALRPDSGTSRGFYVQQDRDTPYGGVFVFTAAASPGVAVGDRVRIVGTLADSFGQSQLASPVVTVEQTDALQIAPLVVDPTAVATGGALAGAYQSMLVRVENVSVIDDNPDTPSDFDEFLLTGNLRVDDHLAPALHNDCPVGTEFSYVQGPLAFSFGNSKILPRAPSDVGVEACSPW